MQESKLKIINVLDIYLDCENPRFDPVEDQNSAIKNLVLHEKVYMLAKDIAKEGLSPIELLAVIKEGKNYIALEGNRRLCALILLNDPERAPDSYKEKFRVLADEYTIQDTVDCKVFESRETAVVWIERRHSGQQDGVGTREWNASQKTRFNQANNKRDNNTLSRELIDYVKKHGLIPKERANKISITTATRFLSNPHFRQVMGITTKSTNPDISIDVDASEFATAITTFFEDLLEGEKVTSRKTTNDVKNYANALLKSQEGLSKKTSDTQLSNFKPSSNNSSNLNQGSSNDSGSRDPSKRKTLIPLDFKVTIKNKVLLKTKKELKKLPVDEFPLAAAMLCRGFLEASYKYYYEKHISTKIKTRDVHILLKEITVYIDKNHKASLKKDERNALKALKVIHSNNDHNLSPQTLGANAHAGFTPSSKGLKDGWDNISAIIIYMLKNI